MTLTYGSLFSGYGGLDLSVEMVTGATCAWHSEVEPAAAQVLAHHWPGVPNLGDITKVRWEDVPPVDLICGGFPCQDLSLAGRGAGIKEGTRSGLWFRYADAVRVLRPRFVFVENVAALLVRGLDIVVGDLAALGYRVGWGCVRASDAGAPHRRERLFILAAADTADLGHERGGSARGWRVGSANGGDAAADADGAALWQHARGSSAEETGPTGRDRPGDPGGERPSGLGRKAAVDANGRGLPQLPQLNGRTDRPNTRDRVDRGHALGRGLEVRWEATPYAAAVARWEPITGRPAPAPTDDRGRLNPVFVEWMMGLPEGWVTGHGLARTAELKMLGNGVVPQQGALALSWLDGVLSRRMLEVAS